MRSKNMKMFTQLVIGFCVIGVLIVFLLYSSYTTAATIVSLEPARQEGYLSNYATFTAIIFIVSVIVISGISITMSRAIRIGMKGLTKVADEMAVGKVDIKAEKKANDEFGILMDDFKKVIENNRNNAEIAQAVASGDMTVEVQPKCAEDALGNALKKMVENNNHTLSNIREAAQQVTTSSSQVASASEALAQGSTEQASAIEQVTASIDDVADRTKQNAMQANEAANLMLQAIEEVKKGNVEMQEMVEAMDAINVASEGISKIIKVIDDIAFQTNILALNAAVEAARAGEAGMGFAVVAEEVRNLAAKSAAAAAETAEMIENSIKKTEIGSRIASETAEALNRITVVVGQSEKIVNEIAEASNYQATAIAQIDQAIDQVSQVVQTNSATSEECAAASMELSNQAAMMRELISVYRLGGDADGAETVVKRQSTKTEKKASFSEGFGKY